jgi:hypothetical protein
MEEKFNDMGVDAFTGSEIMNLAGVSFTDVKNPVVFEKLHDIVKYIKTIPPEQRSYFMNKVIAGKSVNKLDHLFGYVKLNEQRDIKRNELKMLDEEIGFYEK